MEFTEEKNELQSAGGYVNENKQDVSAANQSNDAADGDKNKGKRMRIKDTRKVDYNRVMPTSKPYQPMYGQTRQSSQSYPQRPFRQDGENAPYQRPFRQNEGEDGGYQRRYNSEPRQENNYQQRRTYERKEGEEESYSPKEFFSQNKPRQDYGNNHGGYQQRPHNQYNRTSNYQQGGYRQQGGYQRQGGYQQQGGGYQQGGYQQGGYNKQQGNYQQRGYQQEGRQQYGYQKQEGYQKPEGYQQGGYPRQGGYQKPGGYQRPGGGYGNNQGRYNPNQGGYQQGGYQKRPNMGGGAIRPKKKPYMPPVPVKYPAVTDLTQSIRLNKYLANAGVCSRREADEFIQAGAVKVNDNVITELGTKIMYTDKVFFQDQPVQLESKIYILLNKPKNCVTTSDDPQNRKTVMDLVKNACPERIYPVGRLDRNTTGVLLLTNDGEMAAKLTHPSFKKKKIYHVWLDHEVAVVDMEKLANGIDLEDGEIHADAISYASETDRTQVGIEIHSGRNRIVRRMFEMIGYHVIRLDRVYFAGLTKRNLGRGKWRYLTEQEVNALRMGTYE